MDEIQQLEKAYEVFHGAWKALNDKIKEMKHLKMEIDPSIIKEKDECQHQKHKIQQRLCYARKVQDGTFHAKQREEYRKKVEAGYKRVRKPVDRPATSTGRPCRQSKYKITGEDQNQTAI